MYFRRHDSWRRESHRHLWSVFPGANNFLQMVHRNMTSKLLQLPDKHSVTELLNTWAQSVRQACLSAAWSCGPCSHDITCCSHKASISQTNCETCATKVKISHIPTSKVPSTSEGPKELFCWMASTKTPSRRLKAASVTSSSLPQHHLVDPWDITSTPKIT